MTATHADDLSTLPPILRFIQEAENAGRSATDIAWEIGKTEPINHNEPADPECFAANGLYLPPPTVVSHCLGEHTGPSDLIKRWIEFDIYWRVDRQERPVYAHRLFIRHVEMRLSFNRSYQQQSTAGSPTLEQLADLVADGYSDLLIDLALGEYEIAREEGARTPFVDWFTLRYPFTPRTTEHGWYPSRATEAQAYFNGLDREALYIALDAFRQTTIPEEPIEAHMAFLLLASRWLR